MKLVTVIIFAVIAVIVFYANSANARIPREKLQLVKKLTAVGILLKGKKKIVFPIPLPLPLPIPILKKTQKIYVKEPIHHMHMMMDHHHHDHDLTPGGLGGPERMMMEDMEKMEKMHQLEQMIETMQMLEKMQMLNKMIKASNGGGNGRRNGNGNGNGNDDFYSKV